MKVSRLLQGYKPWIAALVGYVILALALSSQSIDMDEAQTWDYARLTTFSQLIEELRKDPNSEAQMPIGMAAFWVWSQIFGTSEFGMRALNLVWSGLAFAVLAVVGKKTGISWLPLFFAIQPFVWYSMDHARTPVMQMAGGAFLLLGSVEMLEEKPRWMFSVLVLSAGSLILCGASMLGAIPLAAVLILLVASTTWKNMLLSRGVKIFLFVTALLLGLLGIYYFSTLVRGAGGAKLWTVSPSNLLFVAYEFLGYIGLGPGRQEMRDMIRGTLPLSRLWPYLAGWMLLTGGYVLIVLSAVKSWLTRAECEPRRPALRVWILCALIPAISAVLLFCLATAFGFPFWGRHLAGTLPFAVTALAIIFCWSLKGLWRRGGRAGVGLAVLLLIAGSTLIRLAPAHRHDDYRQAAHVAKSFQDEGLFVWWVADHSGGSYYGLEFDQRVSSGGMVAFAHNASDQLPLPDVIVISRPENFDARRTASRLLQDGRFRQTMKFNSFEVWERDSTAL